MPWPCRLPNSSSAAILHPLRKPGSIASTRWPETGGVQQQLAKIASEDGNGVLFRLVGQFTAHFAIHRREDQAIQRILQTASQKIGVRMIGRNDDRFRLFAHGVEVGLELHSQHARTLAAVDRQNAVRRQLGDRLLKLEVVLERRFLLLALAAFFFVFAGLAFLLGGFFLELRLALRLVAVEQFFLG